MALVSTRTGCAGVDNGGRACRGLSVALLLALTACSYQNGRERLADSITRAVIANDLSPVMNRLDPSIKGELTRVRVAQLSDELAAQGAYQGLRQANGTSWCPQDALCFDVQFEKTPYREVMRLAHDGKVRYWWIRAAQQQS